VVIILSKIEFVYIWFVNVNKIGRFAYIHFLAPSIQSKNGPEGVLNALSSPFLVIKQ